MKLSITKAATDFKISRQTIHNYIKNNRLNQNEDKTIDLAEMVRVFGKEENIVNIYLQHEIAALQQQLDEYKQREKWMMQRIEQLHKKLDD